MCDVVCVMWCKAETKKNKNKKNKNKKTNKIKTRFELDSSRQHPRREQTGKKKERKEGGGREKDITKAIANCA